MTVHGSTPMRELRGLRGLAVPRPVIRDIGQLFPGLAWRHVELLALKRLGVSQAECYFAVRPESRASRKHADDLCRRLLRRLAARGFDWRAIPFGDALYALRLMVMVRVMVNPKARGEDQLRAAELSGRLLDEEPPARDVFERGAALVARLRAEEEAAGVESEEIGGNA